jgi:hypothetical protein
MHDAEQQPGDLCGIDEIEFVPRNVLETHERVRYSHSIVPGGFDVMS